MYLITGAHFQLCEFTPYIKADHRALATYQHTRYKYGFLYIISLNGNSTGLFGLSDCILFLFGLFNKE